MKLSCHVSLPWVHLVSESVIVESFESGENVSVYMRDQSPLNTQIVARAVDIYLKMLLKDNFVHSDVHPGERPLPDMPSLARLAYWWQVRLVVDQKSSSTCCLQTYVSGCFWYGLSELRSSM